MSSIMYLSPPSIVSLSVSFHQLECSFPPSQVCGLSNAVSCPFVYLISFAVSVAEMQKLQHLAGIQQQTVARAGSDISAQLAHLLSTGVNNQSTGIGMYHWADINIIDEANTAVGLTLTNQECWDLMAYINNTSYGQSGFKKDLSTAMAKLLPVPVGGINFESDIVCGPVDSYQTLADQPAVLNVQGLNIEGFFTLFAQGAAYVTYPNPQNINFTLQVATEATSLLSQSNVRTALQKSMRTVVLTDLQTYYGLLRVFWS